MLENHARSVLTEMSQGGNKALGDKTGRTITRTTMDGGRRLTNGLIRLNGFETHGLMWVAFVGLISKDKRLQQIGIIVLLALVLMYVAGRDLE